MRYVQKPLPWWIAVLIVIFGLLAVACLDYWQQPEYMRDCLAAGYTRAQCEMAWKWHRYGIRRY